MNSKFSINYIILFCVLSACAFAQRNDIKIISSGAGSLVFEYSPSFSDSSYIKIDNENYLSISLNQGFISENIQAGMPSIPERIINTAVPSEFGNTIEVVKASYKEFNAKIAPVPGLRMESGIPTPDYKVGGDYYNYKPDEELVAFGQYGIARGIPVQSLKMMPVKYFPQQGVVRVYYDIIVKVNFKPGNKLLSAPKDEFSKDIVLNYDAVKYWTKPVNKALYKTVSNSVLATGKWVRFEAPEEGIYKISKSDLAAYGIDASVDPRTIKIYNNSGKMLTESVEKVVPTDLVEVAIYVSGESDGIFNDDDYILFYGRGTNFYEYDASGKTLKRYANYYSNQNYFWITSGGAPGKRMETKNSADGSGAYVQTTTKAMVYLEDEKINLCKSSREFLGDEFNLNTKSRVYTNKLDYLVPLSTIQYNFRFVNTDYNSVELQVDENQSRMQDINIQGRNLNGIYADLTGGISIQRTCTYSSQLPDNRSNLKFFFNASDVSSKGYLDFFEICYDKYLTALNDQLVFIGKDTSSLVEYDLNGFSNSNIKTFDVSDYSAPKIVAAMLISGGEFRFKSIETAGMSSKYLAIGNNNFKTPSNQKTMGNQNLHGISEGAKIIVVTNKLFIDQANKYKAYRESSSRNKLSCVVADIDEIFNEYSGGMVDPSGLRNFVKYAYDNWSIVPEYVLLLGDGTYDYKNIEKYNNNYVVTYQYDYSDFNSNINNLYTYSTDDYFARVDGEDLKTDLAIGRLPVNSADEAETVINKIKHYETESDLDLWRSRITLLADDGYTSTDYEGNDHTLASERIANDHIPASFYLNKIYMATYTAQITGNGRRIPQVTKDLLQSINDGTLILNFIGHGSPEVWTHEYILEKNSFIPQLKNNRYFALIAGTCDFSYADNPSDQSGAEMFVTKKDAGAIVSFASNRLVWSSQNHDMLNAFYDKLFYSSKDSNNLPISIGKAIYLTKQFRIDVNDQKYHLLGDPSIKLLQPQYDASIDSINGLYSPNNLVQLKALSKVKIAGSVKKNGTVQNDFNGEGILTVYDAGRTLFIPQISYTANILGGTIFKGRVSVSNGKFSGDFVVPKDISYDNNRGKMTFYFNNSSIDGIGVNENFTVGGTDTNNVTDTKGPDIKVYFDKESYTNTALVGPNSNLIIKLSDENGLNTTGAGIGHKLEGVLNDDESNSIDFSSYFTGDLDAGGKSGQVVYPLSSLDPGNYKLKVKAWDIYNNYSTLTTDFTVMSENNLVISDVYNYPNPFKQKTTFTFQQSIKKPIDVKIRIFSVAGRLIKELVQENISKGFVTVDWDGRDQDGNQIANGVYLYKIIVKAVDGSLNKSALGKLAIIR